MSNIIIPRHMQAAPKGERYRSEHNSVHENDTQSLKEAKVENWIAGSIGGTLVKSFPGREWRVAVDIPNRVVVIACPSLSNEKGYFMNMTNKTVHDLQEQAKKAGGEILERYNISRDKVYNPEKLEDLERDVRGEAKTRDSNATAIDGSGRVLKDGQK